MKRRRPEQAIQRAIFAHIRARGVRGLVAFHCPNGGARRPAEAAIFKSLGVRAGVSDVIALYNGNFYALELKADNGRATEAQMEFISDVNSAGGFAVIAEGLDPALRILETWGLLKLDRARAPA